MKIRGLFACVVCVMAAMGIRVAAQSAPVQTTVPTETRAVVASATQDGVSTGATIADDGRTPLAEAALARDAAGSVLLAATLRQIPGAGTPEAPITNTRFVVENRSRDVYSYLSGRVTFYDAAGVRCGEGLFTINSLATGELAETDAPGLRLTCAPAAWRITPVALVTGGAVVMGANARLSARTPAATTTPDAMSPITITSATSVAPSTTSPARSDELRLSIEINGTVLPVQLGNPIEIEIGGERVRIVVTQPRP